jgi:hypothetical protein
MNPNTKRKTQTLQTLAQCERLADDLVNRVPFELAKPVAAQRPQYAQGIEGAKARLDECTEVCKQAAQKRSAAIADRDLKKNAHLKASEQLRTAQQAYDKLVGGRVTEQDTAKMKQIQAYVKSLQDDITAANKFIQSAEHKYSFATLQLTNARRDIAAVQSSELIRAALIKVGLFDAIQQAALLTRLKKPQMTANELKADLTTAFFNAVFDDGKIPSFDESLEFFKDFQTNSN